MWDVLLTLSVVRDVMVARSPAVAGNPKYLLHLMLCVSWFVAQNQNAAGNKYDHGGSSCQGIERSKAQAQRTRGSQHVDTEDKLLREPNAP